MTATGTRLCELLLLSSLKNEGLPHYSSATSEQALGSASSPESLLSPRSWTTVALGDRRQEYHASHTHHLLQSRQAGSLVGSGCLDGSGKNVCHSTYNTMSSCFNQARGKIRVLYGVFIYITTQPTGRMNDLRTPSSFR